MSATLGTAKTAAAAAETTASATEALLLLLVQLQLRLGHLHLHKNACRIVEDIASPARNTKALLVSCANTPQSETVQACLPEGHPIVGSRCLHVWGNC